MRDEEGRVELEDSPYLIGKQLSLHGATQRQIILNIEWRNLSHRMQCPADMQLREQG